MLEKPIGRKPAPRDKEETQLIELKNTNHPFKNQVC
jgi:hypothetical protein